MAAPLSEESKKIRAVVKGVKDEWFSQSGKECLAALKELMKGKLSAAKIAESESKMASEINREKRERGLVRSRASKEEAEEPKSNLDLVADFCSKVGGLDEAEKIIDDVKEVIEECGNVKEVLIALTKLRGLLESVGKKEAA